MKVELTGMQFFAFHGCLEAEKSDGNTFVVDVAYTYDGQDAASSDDLAAAVDYSRVYETVRREMAKPSNLLENVAFRIRESILAEFPQIDCVTVSVAKLNPPVGGSCTQSRVTV